MKCITTNLSNLIWTQGANSICEKRSVFLVQELVDHAPINISHKYKYFEIFCNSHRIEYGLTRCPSYLAVVTRDGTYTMTRLESLLQEKDGKLIFDVLRLPDEMNGLRFQKALNFQNSPQEREFNRPHEDIAFYQDSSAPTVWTIKGGNRVIFIIGANFTGKSHFIAENFKDRGYTILDVYDYQQKARKDAEAQHAFVPARELLHQANEALKKDVVDLVREGADVVVEQTFLRSLRRVDLIDAIRKVNRKVSIDVYVMTPSHEQLLQNCAKRAEDLGMVPQNLFDRVQQDLEIFEFPLPSEGFHKIYTVAQGEITERMDPPDWEKLERDYEELRTEALERAKKKEEKERHEKLLQEMNHAKFWHVCEVCEKRDLLTAEEAFNQGWDYPPKLGIFGVLSPRTCGKCGIQDTLWWRMRSEESRSLPLSEKDLETLKRIKNEPESLLTLEVEAE